MMPKQLALLRMFVLACLLAVGAFAAGPAAAHEAGIPVISSGMHGSGMASAEGLRGAGGNVDREACADAGKGDAHERGGSCCPPGGSASHCHHTAPALGGGIGVTAPSGSPDGADHVRGEMAAIRFALADELNRPPAI